VVAAFVVAFAGSAALWWIYFDRSAEASARRIATSPDPGRLERSDYHFIHSIMVAGIIVAAAADEEVLTHPLAAGEAATTWMTLGGAALFLAGHALFKAVVWRVTPWSRTWRSSYLRCWGGLRRTSQRWRLGSARLVEMGVITSRSHPAHT